MSDDEPTGPIKEKLVRTKEKWAREGRALTGTTADAEKVRLPPGQRLTKDFFRCSISAFSPTSRPSRLEPDGRRGKWRIPLKMGLAYAFMAQPQVTLTNDIHCVTTWSRYDNAWVGVRMRDLLAQVRPFDTAEVRECCAAMMAIPPIYRSPTSTATTC